MAKISAGLLLYRRRNGGCEVLLVHPGGPFWASKDAGAWTIPKGEVEESEHLFAAACREFEEETGFCPEGRFLPLTPVKQSGGKIVHAWAIEGECDPASVKSNTFTMVWPPRSGRMQAFPEIDKAAFFDLKQARAKITPAQEPLLDQLAELLSEPGDHAS